MRFLRLVGRVRVRVLLIAISLAALGRPAAAQRADVQADAAINVGYTQTTRTFFVPDPNGMAADRPAETSQSMFMEIRPGIMAQTGSPRLTWRAGYIFAGTLSVVGDSLTSASNQVNGSMTAEITKFSVLTLSAVIAQGGTSFQLSSRPADAGQPELRAPGNPDQISATAAESMITELGKQLVMQQTVVAAVNAPQDSFDQRNTALSASLALDRVFELDAIGLELHGGVSWLRPLQAGMTEYKSYTSSIRGHWNHDITTSWSGAVNAGVDQVFTDTGSKPLAFLPAGALSLRYTPQADVGGGIDISHGTNTNLQIGSVSLTDQVSVHGAIAIDARKSRGVAFSAGLLHNEPLGEVSALVAAGTGNALQVDAGFTTGLAKDILGTARYSMAYQFDQGGGLPNTLAHVVFIGVTGSIRNTEKPMRPFPVRGRRVDGGDGDFPVVEEAPVEPPRQ
jgi:hypothetical protein